LADKQVMNWTSLAAGLRQSKAEMNRQPEWVESTPELSPAKFSRQLLDLQVSLLRANAANAGLAKSVQIVMSSQTAK